MAEKFKKTLHACLTFVCTTNILFNTDLTNSVRIKHSKWSIITIRPKFLEIKPWEERQNRIKVEKQNAEYMNKLSKFAAFLRFRSQNRDTAVDMYISL